MAEYVVKLRPKGNYAFVNGPAADNNAALIRKGQMNILQPYIDKGDIKIVLDKSVGAWGPLESLLIMEDFLAQYKGTVDVVMAASDNLSDGVVQALSTNERFKKTLVTGQDASLTACRNIIIGLQTMSVYKSSKKMGSQAAELAMKLAKGEAVRTNTTVNNGKRDVPSILFDGVLVDKNNVKDVVTKEGHIKASDL